jgi:hypothetical protein
MRSSKSAMVNHSQIVRLVSQPIVKPLVSPMQMINKQPP